MSASKWRISLIGYKIALIALQALRTVCVLIALLGFVVVVSFDALVSDLLKDMPSSREMPLGGARGIGVDSQGNVYCCLEDYDRMQKYDRDGNFLTGWQYRGNRGGYYVRITEKDEVELGQAANGGVFYRFSADGTVLYNWFTREGGTATDSGSASERAHFPRESRELCQDADGYRYVIEGMKIMRYGPDGSAHVFASSRDTISLFMTRYAWWALAICAGIIGYLCDHVKKKLRKRMKDLGSSSSGCQG